MNPALRDIVIRLQGEINQGLGDGTAILTESSINIDNPNNNRVRADALTIYAQQGKSLLSMRYIFLSRMGYDDIRPMIHNLPDEWPTPSLNEVLKFVDQTQTPYIRATDGTSMWQGMWTNRKFTPVVPPRLMEAALDPKCLNVLLAASRGAQWRIGRSLPGHTGAAKVEGGVEWAGGSART